MTGVDTYPGDRPREILGRPGDDLSDDPSVFF